jgi:hypothetical protein
VSPAASRALLVLTPAVPLLGLAPGGRWVWPLAAPLTLWAIFAPAVRAGDYRKALLAGLAWAALLSAGVIAWTERAPRAAGRGIVNAEPYRIEMFGWIEPGRGKENEPARFLPEHLLHLAGFAVLTAATGGYLGLALGALLTGYMSYFVGAFAFSAGRPVLGALAAWVPWSVVRVVAFVALGTVLARLLLARGGAEPAIGPRERRWIAAALGGIVIDVVVKALAAPAYGRFLRSLLAD